MGASTRRDILLAGMAAAIGAAADARLSGLLHAQEGITAHDFLALSQKLTGVTDLDETVAETLLDGFLATGNGAALAQLAQGVGQDGPLANAIVAAWYSGLYETGKGKAVATFDGALVWNALTFTKPFGVCGDGTGYWANPPQT